MRRLEASYTVEAALVMGIVLWTLGFLVRSSYQMHDIVTGGMILQESVENVRYNQNEEIKTSYFSEIGQKLGEPRLWLKDFQIMISEEGKRTVGRARAGKWSMELSMGENRPERFLRKYQAFFENWGGDDADGG